MLLSFRRQILWETPFLPSPGSVSVPTFPPPSLVPPPCVFAASPHAPEWLQFWGAISCFPFWEREGRGSVCPGWFTASCAQGTLQPQTLLFMPDEVSCMSIIFSCRLMELSLTTKLLFWQRNRALDVHRETETWSYPLSKSSTVNWYESPDPLVTGMVIGRSWVPLSLCPIYGLPGFAFSLSLPFLPPPQ